MIDLSRRALLEIGGASMVAGTLGLTSEASAAGTRSRGGRTEVAYICNCYSDSISVVDVSAGKVIDTISMDFGPKKTIDRWAGMGVPGKKVELSNTPMNAMLSPDGTQLWVPNGAGRNLAVVDVATRKIVRKIDLPAGPNSVSLTPDGRKAVCTMLGSSWVRQGSIGIVDVATGALTNRTMIGSQPEEMVLLPDGRRAIAASKSLWIFNVETGEVEADLPTSHLYYHLVSSSDGSKIYISALFGVDKLMIYNNDPDPMKMLMPVTVEANCPTMMALSSDEQTIYTTSSSKQTLQLIDLKTNRVVKTLPIADQDPGAIALTKDGNRALISHSAGNTLTVVDTAAFKVIGKIQVGEGPSSIAMGFI